MIDKKRTNIYILGAGASKDDGAPLMNEFFECVFTGIGGRIIPDPNTGKKVVDFDATVGLPDDEEEIIIYERLAKRLDQIYNTEFQKDIHLIRTSAEVRIPSYSSKARIHVEQVLSEIDQAIRGETDFHGQTEETELKSLRNDLYYLIFDTLGNTIALKRPHRYLSFVNKKLVHGDIHIIITFNYDVLLEEALTDPELFYQNKYESSAFNVENCENGKSPWSYELDFIDLNGFEPCYSMSSDFVKVLKLHGSLNWSRCSKCGGLLLRVCGNLFAYKSVVQGKIICPRCHVIAEPVLIPPSTYKNIDDPNIRKIWDLSCNWLSKADTISIIGYSLPQSDVHVHKLLEHAGKGKQKGYILNIINPCVVVQNRFCNILSAGALEVRKYHSFCEYLEARDCKLD